MYSKANSVLSQMRTELESELQGRNLRNAHLVEDTYQFSEAEQRFCAEALSLVEHAGFELEGFDVSDPDEMVEVLEHVAQEEGGNLAESIAELLAPPMVEAKGPVIAMVPSASNPDKTYEIRLGKDGNVYCTCPAWKYQKIPPAQRTCKHLDGLSKKLSGVAGKLGSVKEGLAAALGSFFQTEAKFCEEGLTLLLNAGWELEGFDVVDAEAVAEALTAAAAEEGGKLAEAVGNFFASFLSEEERELTPVGVVERFKALSAAA